MFKQAFKFYKSKIADLSNIVNISSDDERLQVFHTDSEFVKKYFDGCIYGLKPATEWNIFVLKNKPGLILIKNPFTALGQRYWIVRCVRDFSRKPSKLNIDAHNYISEGDNWWDACHSNEGNNLLSKLRWATLGYHHNWDTKIYEEASKGQFPQDLSEMCACIARAFDYKFRAQAAIVNYYPMNSTLSGHTDHSENDLDAPLISISFGQSAIFLIGGHTEDCPATPVLLNSGDIIIMSKESRLCYHGVPRVLSASTDPWNATYGEDVDEKLTATRAYLEDATFWKPFDQYIQTSRININVRQVLKFGQNTLT